MTDNKIELCLSFEFWVECDGEGDGGRRNDGGHDDSLCDYVIYFNNFSFFLRIMSMNVFKLEQNKKKNKYINNSKRDFIIFKIGCGTG